MEEPSEYVDFMARYKDWITIKRLGIRGDTKPEEITHHLAGIRAVIDRKAYSFLDIDTASLDAYASKITAGMRKGYSSLVNVATSLGNSETKSTLKKACGDKKLMPIAETYLLGKAMTNIGFDSGINQKLMSRVFPALKPPKVPGRKPKA